MLAYNSCHNNVSQTEYFTDRGLSQKTIDKFKLGYDPEKNLVTIPYNPDCNGYVERILWDGNSKYYKHGNELFNVKALYEKGFMSNSDYVFITEGQIDAMSFEEIDLCAVGLGGVNEVSKLVQMLKEKPSNKVLVLALDNDKATRYYDIYVDILYNQRL